MKFTYVLLEIIACGGAVKAYLTAKSCRAGEVSAEGPSTSGLGSVASAGEVCLQSDGGRAAMAVTASMYSVANASTSCRISACRRPVTAATNSVGEAERRSASYDAKAPTSWRLVDKRSRKRIAPNVAMAQTVVAPGSGTTTAAAGASGPQASVGTYATTTGKPCPASRWSRSKESPALDGPR